MTAGAKTPNEIVRLAQLRVLACKVGLRAHFFYWIHSFYV